MTFPLLFDQLWTVVKDAQCPEELFVASLEDLSEEKAVAKVKKIAHGITEVLTLHKEEIDKKLLTSPESLSDYLHKLTCYTTWAIEKIRRGGYGNNIPYRVRLEFLVERRGDPHVFSFKGEVCEKKIPGRHTTSSIVASSIPASAFRGQYAFGHHRWRVIRGDKDIFTGSISHGWNRHQDGAVWINRDQQTRQGYMSMTALSSDEFKLGDLLQIDTTSHGSARDFFFAAKPHQGSCECCVLDSARNMNITLYGIS